MHISKTEINNFLNGLNKAKGYPKTKIEWVALIPQKQVYYLYMEYF
jgi:hypothetical protein